MAMNHQKAVRYCGKRNVSTDGLPIHDLNTCMDLVGAGAIPGLGH